MHHARIVVKTRRKLRIRIRRIVSKAFAGVCGLRDAPPGRSVLQGGPAAMACSSPVSDGRAWRVADGYRSVAGPYASKPLVKDRTLEAI
jgi:hypothetical protein